MRNANLFSKRTLSRNEDGILAKERNILRPITICWDREKEGTSLNMTAFLISIFVLSAVKIRSDQSKYDNHFKRVNKCDDILKTDNI